VQARPVDRRPRGLRISRAAIVLLTAAVAIALVRAFLVQSFVIPSGSMEPTLRVGDRVLVARYSYLFGQQPSRGDVIVFDGGGVFDPLPAPAGSPLASAGRAVAGAFGLPVGSRDYVKRVIGLPGDRVTCCTPAGQLIVNGVPLDEPYLFAGDAPSVEHFDIVVPAGRLWVMGDHRSASADSRSHLGDPGGGTVPVDRVVGRVLGVFWPTSHLGILRHVSYGAKVPSSVASSAEGTG
jgi:signal peptidase I